MPEGYPKDYCRRSLRNGARDRNIARGEEFPIGEYELFREGNPDVPSNRTIREKFGSWKKAVEELGYRTAGGNPPKYSEEELWEKYVHISDKMGHWMSIKEYRNDIYSLREKVWYKKLHRTDSLTTDSGFSPAEELHIEMDLPDPRTFERRIGDRIHPEDVVLDYSDPESLARDPEFVKRFMDGTII